MFTGIVRHTGVVTSVHVSKAGARLTVGAADVAGDLSRGDSVCVNGVCLTVVDVREALIEFDVIDETLRRSTLGSFRKGIRVNLESSLRIGDTLDGHFVQGHVDATAVLTQRDPGPSELVLWFRPEAQVTPYLVPKGSVAVDGVSLTIAEVKKDAFSVALIPTTLEITTLRDLSVSDRVNVESDIIARTVVHHLRSAVGDPIHRTDITLEHLKSHGFA